MFWCEDTVEKYNQIAVANPTHNKLLSHTNDSRGFRDISQGTMGTDINEKNCCYTWPTMKQEIINNSDIIFMREKDY